MADITFHEVQDSVVILAKNGIYRQTKAYIRANRIYAKWSGGYIALHKRGTGIPSVRHDGVELGFKPKYDKCGRMVHPDFTED